MLTNLLRTTWTQLDSYELRLLLDGRIGGPGQYDNCRVDPKRIDLPLAGADCRVTLTYSGQAITCIEPGQAFDQSQWDAIAEEIETKILAGPRRIGREFSFCSHRVPGSWYGNQSEVQILPPPSESPTAPVECADHPFILEFPIRDAGYRPINHYRRMREHRRLTLLLNTLLAARLSIQNDRRHGHSWGCFPTADGELDVRWVQNSYVGPLGEGIVDVPSSSPTDFLEVVPAHQYFEKVRGIDGLGLRVPSDLDASIRRYQQLPLVRREEFDRAAYWLDMSSRLWTISTSLSFGSLVAAVESLINKRGRGSAARFRDFIERYAPCASLEDRRKKMYELRSDIHHGSSLMTLDHDISFGWDPPGLYEMELHEQLGELTRRVIRSWLRNPPPS